MRDAFPIAAFGAAGLAMIGAMFGVGLARLVWAGDLDQAKRLKVMWDQSRAAMERTIEAKERTIVALQGTITTLKKRLGEGND